MKKSHSRITSIVFCFIVGATLGLKTAVMLGFVLGIPPSLDPGVGIALSWAWILAVAVAFAVMAAVASKPGKQKPAAAVDVDGP